MFDKIQYLKYLLKNLIHSISDYYIVQIDQCQCKDILKDSQKTENRI